MEYLLFIYLTCLFVTFFGSTIYHRGQKEFTDRIGKQIDDKSTMKMISKINANHREVMFLSLIPIVNTITAIVMLLGAIKELLDGIDDVILKLVDLWRRFKVWIKI